MALPTFQWGGNTGQIKSPATVERERRVAEALMANKGIAQNPWEGLSQVTGAYTGSVLQDRADEAEAAGREKAGALFSDLAINQDPNAIIAALTSPDAQWASDAQTSIASALLNQGLERSDPAYQLDLDLKRAELEAMRQPKPIDPTTAMQNYEYLVGQGVDPAQAQGMAFGSGGTTINNMGNIPAGYEVIQDPETGATRMQPIPGGPADQDARAAEAAAATGQEQTERYGNVVTEDIGRALDIIEKDPTFTTGVVGQALSQVGGTPANRVRNLVETVKSNVGFDRLQAMRESSPTGGALGSVTERELSLLTSAIGSLEQSNNADDLAYNLRRVNKIYMDIIHGPGNWEPSAQSSGEGWQDMGGGIRVKPMGQ